MFAGKSVFCQKESETDDRKESMLPERKENDKEMCIHVGFVGDGGDLPRER